MTTCLLIKLNLMTRKLIKIIRQCISSLITWHTVEKKGILLPLPLSLIIENLVEKNDYKYKSLVR